VVREAAVVASVEVVAATEAVISLLLIPAELRSFPSVVRDAEASEVAVAAEAEAEEVDSEEEKEEPPLTAKEKEAEEAVEEDSVEEEDSEVDVEV
jgi:hypothetical protein